MSTTELETNESDGHLLSDIEIVRSLVDGCIKIVPLLDLHKQLGPMSLDLRLGTDFIITERSEHTHLDPVDKFAGEEAEKRRSSKRILDPRIPFVLHPGEFVLGSTLEFIVLPNEVAGILDGRSSWAREGLQVHSTASFIQPGTMGVITFELQNVGHLPIKLYVGSRIAQISFIKLSKPAIRTYRKLSQVDDYEVKYANSFRTQSGAPWKDKEFGNWPRKDTEDKENLFSKLPQDIKEMILTDPRETLTANELNSLIRKEPDEM